MWTIPDDFDRSAAADLVDRAAGMWANFANHVQPDAGAHVLSAPQVTLTFPHVAPEQFQQWLGSRLVFWPDGVCGLKRVALVSSRLGLRHDRYSWWYDLLRTAVLRVGDGECLSAVAGTMAFSPTMRAAELFGLPSLRLETVDTDECSRDELTEWLLHIHRKEVCHNATNVTDLAAPVWRAFVSPRLVLLQTGDSGVSDESLNPSEQQRGKDSTDSQPHRPSEARDAKSAAARDRALVLAGQRTYVLSCRAGGNVEALIRRKLDRQPDDGSLTLVASSPELSSSMAASLTESGAVPWIVSGLSMPDDAQVDSATDGDFLSRVNTAATSDGPLEAPEQWLLHWTRPRFGPWPEQDATEFLDELILGCESANRSALAALLRIAATGRLVASRNSVRGDADVVSLTAVPLTEFRQRRVFRRHRHRFDFEPWGVAVRKATLQTRGARPVVYGDKAARDELPDDDRTFFQLATDRTGLVDWSQEREWRLVGSLNLTDLPTEDVCLFVDTPQQAALFEEFPWHVVVCPAA